MPTNDRRECKELTSAQLFNLLSTLPEDIEADHELAKRACCRWLLRAPAELYYTAQDGTEAKQYASVRDICITGIGLLCKAPIPPGIVGRLLLPMEDRLYKVNVKVSHCTQTVGSWRIGCQLLLPDAIQLVPMVNRAARLHQEQFERNGR